MKKPPRNTFLIESILAQHTPEIRTLVEQLRQLVRQAVPEAIEAAYPVWRGLGYHHLTKGYFCGIFPQKDSVNLGFEFGVLLPDPDGVLEGTGKQVRYVRIHHADAIPVEAIRRLIGEALKLPQSRQEKLAMIRMAARPAPADKSLK